MKIATTVDYGKLRIIFNFSALKYLYDSVYYTEFYTLILYSYEVLNTNFFTSLERVDFFFK